MKHNSWHVIYGICQYYNNHNSPREEFIKLF